MAGRQETFGEQLRRHREAAGYSQEQLAERAGVSANAVGALERGERRRPYPDTVRRLAEALGLDQDARLALTAAARERSPEVARTAQLDEVTRPGLPGEPTPIVGRERELAELGDLLSGPGERVLTLVGPGGVGKSRLALALAGRVTSRYADGAIWVELAPLTDHTLVLSTVSRAVGLRDGGGGDVSATLRSWLRDHDLLLVLDNLEHLLGAVPDLAQLLLACPGLHLLTTSRAPLRLRGEQEYHVPPLEVPPAGTEPGGRDLAAIPAVDFFLRQAQRKNATFAPSSEQLVAVAEICRRLDGLPLALELVAARTRTLTPVELLARVDDLLPLLVGGARDLPERQQTMRAAIAWSEELLDPAQRALFQRLAVFAGGWTLSAAEAVCADEPDPAVVVLDHLEGLVEQSLVAALPVPEGTRYRMLEPVRQFARQRLESTGEADAVRRHHAAHFCALAEEAAEGLEGRADQSIWVSRLGRELDNLRAALAWSEHSADDGAAETGLRLAAALWRFWEMRWYVEEGLRWVEGALVRNEQAAPALRARALNAAGNLARDQGDHQRATAYHERCLALRRTLGDTRGVASSLNNLGVVARDQGDAGRTRELCGEALELFRLVGDPHGAAIALISLGAAATQQGDLALARAGYGESLEHFRGAQDTWHTGWLLVYLAQVDTLDGELSGARERAGEALELHRAGGDPWGVGSALRVLARADEGEGALDRAATRYAEAVRHLTIAGVERAVPGCLDDLAAVALAAGAAERAARLAGASRAWRGRAGLARAPLPQLDRSADLEPLRSGPYAAAWQAGSTLTREQVLDETAAAVAEVSATAPP